VSALLEATGIVKRFAARRGGQSRAIQAVADVSLAVRRGETLGLVGESGCGKTTLSRILIGIETATAGSVCLDGSPVETRADWRALRRRVQYVFQDPYTSLCPTMRVGRALLEPLTIHGIGARAERQERVRRTLELFGLAPETAGRLPAQLSGGQRQRVSLARALMLEPELMICDEIVSGLDVSVQAQVLTQLTDLQARLGLALLFISHDLRVVRYLADRVAVMYLGRIVEAGPVDAVFDDPQHPYTRALLAAIPDHSRREVDREARILRGEPADLGNDEPGCPFAGRCPIVEPACRTAPAPVLARGSHEARCRLAWMETGNQFPS
jgi:oligopeptide/dipeptide ABC transporter ATP-binding protein